MTMTHAQLLSKYEIFYLLYSLWNICQGHSVVEPKLFNLYPIFQIIPNPGNNNAG